ncbi:MAG: AAA family ATPase [Dehalococcoidia bacterium]|nr:AAA family ATPase [Dehalococcoidia bacterium]
MQLRGIHIDSFGVLSDRHVTELSSGINVIHGPNEFGKTTLLDFIRRILFGFPDRRFKGNLYRVPGGGAHCGRLVCWLAKGKTVIISRREGTDGGPVRILIDSTEFADQKELNRILGDVGGGFYQNVYAIDLDELGRKESLEEDEVESHIYGAGLGLGNISLKGIKDRFKDEAEKLFIPPGRAKKEIPQRYNEIRELERDIRRIKGDLSKYDETVSKRDELNAIVNSLNEQIRTLEENKRKLESQKKLYKTYVELSDAVVELAELEELPLFTEGALSELEKLKSKITNLDGRIDEETEELTKLEFQRDQLVYDERIIEIEPYIISLHGESEDFRKAATDIEKIKLDKDKHDQLVKEGIERVGHGWIKESVRDFNLSVLQKDKIRTTKANLDDAERKLREQSKGLAAPSLLKYPIYLVTALGLICAVSGFIAAQTLVAVLSAITFVVGVGLILFMLLSKRPGQEYRKLSEAKNRLLVGWQEFLEGINFDVDLSPDGAKDLADEINGIKSKLELLDSDEERIRSMQATIAKVETLHNQVAGYFDRSKISDDMSTNIEIFRRLLEEAKKTKGEKDGLIDQISQQNKKIEGIKNKRRLAEEELQSYIFSLGAKDEDDFRRRYEIFRRSKELKDKINKSKEIIQSTVGMGDHYNSFIESISATNPDEIESAL